jgi:hypothetical protein
MKRLASNRNLGRKKYSKHPHTEHAGVGMRQLTDAEIAEFQAHVDRIREGSVMRPIRLPASLRGFQ